mgnify:FL=1
METLNSFIRKYAELHSIPMTQARAEIERFESAFKEITVESGGVDLRGFIKSEVVNVPAKKGRNPKTGATIDIAPKKVVKIKVSSKFKNLEE